MNRFAGLTIDPEVQGNRFEGLKLGGPETVDDYWARGLSNIPSDLPKSMWAVVKELGQAASEVPGIFKKIAIPSRESVGTFSRAAQMAKGLTGAGYQGDPMDPNTPRAQTLRMMEQAASYLPGGEQWPEHPTRAAVELAGLIGGPAKGSGILSRVARAGRYIDPLNAAGGVARGAQKLATGAMRKGPALGGHMIGLTTGQGPGPAMEGMRVSRARQGEAFLTAPRGRLMPGIGSPDVPGLGKEIAEGLNQRRRAAGAVKGRFMDEMDQAAGYGQYTLPEGSVNISDLKRQLVGNLDRGGEGGLLATLGIRPERSMSRGGALMQEGVTSSHVSLDVPASFRAVDQGVFEEAVRSLLESPDVVTVRHLDDIKIGIDKIPLGSRHAQTQRVVKQVRGAVRDKLAQVPGYDAAVRPIAEHMDELANESTGIATQLGRSDLAQTRKPINAQALGESLTRSLNEGVSQADRMRAVERIEEMLPGSNLQARAAGLRFSGDMPTGLVGKGQFMKLAAMAGLGGAGAGIGAAAVGGMGGAAVGALLAVPVIYIAFIPKYAARTLTKLGAVQRHGDNLQNLAETAIKQGAALGIDVRKLTLGRLLDELDNARQQSAPSPASLLGRLGGMSTSGLPFPVQ